MPGADLIRLQGFDKADAHGAWSLSAGLPVAGPGTALDVHYVGYGSDLRAWAVGSVLRHTFASLPQKPFLEFGAHAAGGDTDNRTRGSYAAMFPGAGPFGDTRLLGSGNLVKLRSAVGMTLDAGWSVSGALGFYWGQRLRDGIHAPAIKPARAAGGSRERYVGATGEAMLNWQVNPNLSFRANYSVFEPGSFIDDTGRSKASHFFMTYATVNY